MAKLIKLAKMAGVMHVPFLACVINSPSTFTYYLDLSNFISESGLSYFRVLTICLLLVYFVSAAGCHCFDLT